jgi:MFS family permease
MADKVTDAKKHEINQVKWLTRAQILTAICYIVTYSIGFRFSIGYITTSTISPSTITSKDPKIGEKFVTFAGFTTSIIVAQRVVNLLTGTAFGEIGQALGRKKLVFVALMGYALGSFFMLLGFLTSKPDTWETCYKPCYAEKFAANETTAEKLCVDQCVIEDAADGSHFNGSILYIISQGIIGMCSPFGIVASSFIVDVSVDYNSFVKNYAHMRAFGFAGGLGFGYFFGLVGLIVLYVIAKSAPAFLIAMFVSGIVFGTIGTAMGGLMLVEPLTEEKKKKCCVNPMDYLFFSSLIVPMKMGMYTFFLWLANAMYALFFAYWESVATHYMLWNYGVNVVIVMVAVVVVFVAQLIAIKCIIPRIGFRRSIYWGYSVLWIGILMLALTRKGPNDTATSQPTGMIVVFIGGLCYMGNGCVQSSMLALYNSQGGPKDTGPLGGAWKTGEASFKLVGSILALVIYPNHVAACNADPTMMPGAHWLYVAAPAIILLMVFFMIADQKYGHLAKSQEYQQDNIFGSWGATAKADFTDAVVQDATDKNADA